MKNAGPSAAPATEINARRIRVFIHSEVAGPKMRRQTPTRGNNGQARRRCMRACNIPIVFSRQELRWPF